MPDKCRRLPRGLLTWGCLVTVLGAFIGMGLWGAATLRRREAVMADALATFGRRAVQTEAHYPPWARSLIGADREPNGWEIVTAIDLEGSAISDDDLPKLVADLRRFPDVRVLDLQETDISDVGLAHLKALSSFQFINIAGTRVTTEGVASLQRALPGVIVQR